MARTVERTLFKFHELDDRAKERARDWFRAGMEHDRYSESVTEDAAIIADKLGINLRTRPVKLMGGGTRYEPCIWSGFSSQGDGACFEGTYSYQKGAAAAVREYAPQDTELHKIAEALRDVQHANFYALSATTRHRGHYYHSGCMEVDVERTDDRTMTTGAEDTVTEALRDFADWIYRQLEKEHDYRMSDEAVDEDIDANDYEFTEDGERV